MTGKKSSQAQETAFETAQRAAAACLRAVSEIPDIKIAYGATPVLDDTHKIRLSLARGEDAGNYRQQLRGESDAAASRKKNHDPDFHKSFPLQGLAAREVFNALEQARAEAVTAKHYKGVKSNLARRYSVQAEKAGLPESKYSPMGLAHMAQIIAWSKLAGDKPDPAIQSLQESDPELSAAMAKFGEDLRKSLLNQKEYARTAKKIIQHLGLLQDDPGPENDPSAKDSDDNPGDNNQDGGDAKADGPKQDQSPALPQDEVSQNAAQSAQQNAEQKSTPAKAATLPFSHYWEATDPSRYRAFTKEFDEVLNAENICPAEEMEALRATLDQYLAQMPQLITRLANKLQRKLLAQQARRWNHDLEHGILDTSHLTRLIANPMAQNLYMEEISGDFRDTAVTLLIDNSGSMRGRPIIIAALSADILARTLERCGVKVEILGFTTRSWKGGQPYEKWLAAGKPPNPGRLNDLRHIIYKSADQSWRRTRNNLGAMLREGLLKENIDGEALLWAHHRLLARPEQRRILMVISDGAPVDDLTSSANGGVYLEQHLRSVIHWIEEKSAIELLAIGIGHDVTRYYKQAITISDVEQLAPVLLGQMSALLDG